jgi:hypothetical protein
MAADPLTSPAPHQLPSPYGEIIETVYRYRFLADIHVSRLYNLVPGAAREALARLPASGYLAAIQKPSLAPGGPRTVYALAQRGANYIASRWGMDREKVRWRKYHNYVGLLFVDHRLAVNDVRIAFTAGARRWGYSIEGWWYELPIREDVDDADEKAPPLVLRPDAYFTLLVDQRRLHLFLEVDMGTESHGRFAAKIRRYLAYKQSGLFRIRFGGRSFRVLVVAPTVTRLRSLKRVTESQGGQRMFWFAPLHDVTVERIGMPIWQLAGESVKARLFGPTGGSAI